MTRPSRSALVVDGEAVKARLLFERSEGRGLVHIDWLRFTVVKRDAPMDLDVLFPSPDKHFRALQESGFCHDATWYACHAERNARQIEAIKSETQWSEAGQALSLAREVCEVLGEGFAVGADVLKGHDFYARRWPITLNDAEVGWVGFGTSSDSPRQRRQGETIHCNLYGMACTFARSGWREAMADKIDEWQANITRVDLALDFFDGQRGGLDGVIAGYESGSFDMRGRRPDCSGAGDWVNRRARSFYVGSKEAGKQTNVYEKGAQLFGKDSANPWLRWELRYGNKLRDLDSSILRDPDGVFAGASGAHALALAEAGALPQAQEIKVRAKLAEETVQAEVQRNVRWLQRVAAPSIAAAWSYLGDEGFLSLVTNQVLPRRLQKFASQVPAAFVEAGSRLFGSGAGPAPMTAFY